MNNIGVTARAITILLAGFMLTGCFLFATDANAPIEATPAIIEIELPELPDNPSPDTALAAIYTHFEGHISDRMSFALLMEIIGIDEIPADRLYARHSNARGGLTDVIIIRPHSMSMGEVREILYRYRDRRVEEFENFDILGSLNIARSAVIFEHGEYLVLLMTADNDEAQIIINRHMPL